MGSLQRCIELQMNSKLNSRKAKDFMGFETVKEGNILADKHSKSHLKKIQQGCFELGKGNRFVWRVMNVSIRNLYNFVLLLFSY